MPDSTSHLPLAAFLGIGLLIAWRIYRRIRRLVGRQRFRPVRSWFSLIFFSLLVLGLLAGLYSHPLRAAVELGGVLVGIGLAVYGLRLTKFENTADGLYYTPNAHIGIALSLLLAGRVAYRLFQVYVSTSGFVEPPQVFVRSPPTLLVVGTLAGYYAWYALGLIRWHRSVANTAPSSVVGGT